MTSSLQIQSLTALARKFWDVHRFARANQPTIHELMVVVKKFDQIDILPLPAQFKNELRLAILEFMKRIIAKESLRVELSLETERPAFLARALRECLPKYFRYLGVPAPRDLHRHFPELHQRRMVVDFFFALVLPNHRDDANAIIRKCWTSTAFSPIQSIFLDNFIDIWDTIFDGVSLQTMGRFLTQYAGCNAYYQLSQLQKKSNSNETIPWFVFELLDRDQRDNFLALFDTISEEDISGRFINFWATIFSHWPWQREAFDKCFANKQELSHNDISVLKVVLRRKHYDEWEAMRAHMLLENVSFYVKVKAFLNARNVQV